MMSSSLRRINFRNDTYDLVLTLAKRAESGKREIGRSHKQYSHIFSKSQLIKLFKLFLAKHPVCYVGVKLAVKMVKLVTEATR